MKKRLNMPLAAQDTHAKKLLARGNSIVQDTTLQKAHDYFNEQLFKSVFDREIREYLTGHDDIPPVLVGYKNSRNARGFYRPDCNIIGDNTAAEINMCAVSFSNTPDVFFSTLVHEMCHHYQHIYGKTPSKWGWHTIEFSEMMEKLGLITSDTGLPGGKRVGRKMSHYIDPNGEYIKVFNAMPKEFYPIIKPIVQAKRMYIKPVMRCLDCGGSNVVTMAVYNRR